MKDKDFNEQHKELFYVLSGAKDIKRAEEIIQSEDFDIKAIDDEGQQIIHYAARNGLTHIIELLLKKGSDINAKAIETTPYSRQYKDWTPLHFLANSEESANEKSALVLIENGADLNIRDYNNSTPLLVLGEEKIHRKLALLFIDNGADINAVNNQHENILCKQMWKSSLDFIQQLIDRKIDLKDKAGVIALCQAIQHHTVDYVRLLLQQGVSTSAIGEYNPLAKAAKKGDLEIFSLLIEHGADLAQNKNHLLQEAIIGKGEPASQKRILEMCLRQGIDFSNQNLNCVNLAASFNADWAIDLLVAHGADINYLDNENRTPLVHAAIRNHKNTIEALLKHDVDLSGESGLIALLYSDDFSIAQMLVKAGVELNRMFESYTALQSAVEKMHFKKVKLFLENGADPNIHGKEKAQPLLHAVNKGRTDIIQLLLLHGADRNFIVDQKGSIADHAAKSKKEDVASLFNMTEQELKAYKPKRPYLRFINQRFLFAEGIDAWNDIIKAQIKKLFGKMSTDAIKEETGEIEYFDIIDQTGKPTYQLMLNDIGDGGLFVFDKNSLVGEIIQHGFEITKKISPESKDELREMLFDAYESFEGKIQHSVDFK